MVYPTLLAAIGDDAHPSFHASAVGVHRFWRDVGYAIGAGLEGITADAFGLPAAMWLTAALTFAFGVVVAIRMRETIRGQVDGTNGLSLGVARRQRVYLTRDDHAKHEEVRQECASVAFRLNRH